MLLTIFPPEVHGAWNDGLPHHVMCSRRLWIEVRPAKVGQIWRFQTTLGACLTGKESMFQNLLKTSLQTGHVQCSEKKMHLSKKWLIHGNLHQLCRFAVI